MEVPPSLKSLAPFLRLSKQFESRDPVVSYHCQLYFVQNGIKIADNEGKRYLLGVMDKLEGTKADLIAAENEAVNNELVASSHIEGKALQLFLFADREDRASNFDTKVIKTFYTSSLLFELLTLFGELSEENAHHKKYAQWKATYLEKCRRSGEQPVPGPELHDEEQQPGGSGEQDYQAAYNPPSQPAYNPPSQPAYNPPSQPAYNPPVQPAYIPPAQPTYIPPAQPTYNPPAQPAYNPPAQPAYNPPPQPTVTAPPAGDILRLDLSQHQAHFEFNQIERLQKLCRFASSSLNFQDYSSCLDNLQRAINLIRVGREE